MTDESGRNALTELTLTIAPRPAASMRGRALRVARTATSRLRVIEDCQSSSVTLRNPPVRVGAAPTLFTRMSIRSPASATSRDGPSVTARSNSATCTRPARASSSSPADDFRAPAMTRTSFAASPRTTASPIPRLAPVTTATLPDRPRSIAMPQLWPSPGPVLRPAVVLCCGLAAVLRGEREREQRVRRVVGGRLDRWPADYVVLVGSRLGVEQLVAARAAGPHPADRAEPGEVARAARAVDGRADLDVAGTGQRAGQVGDLALHAARERGTRPDHERRAPRVGTERVGQLLAGEALVGA